MDYDVGIIGGGPAGAAAGLTLLKRPGVTVRLLEAGDYSEFRVGETLSPGTRPLLDYLGVWDAIQEGGCNTAFYGTKAAWGRPEISELDFLFTIHGQGWSLNRGAFDHLLAQQFQRAGGELSLGSRFRDCNRREGGGWTVRARNQNDLDDRFTCRYLIDATGRKAMLAKRLGATRTVHDQLVGIVRNGRLTGGAKLPADLTVEAVPDGWWYTASLPDGRVTATFMTDAHLAAEGSLHLTDKWEEGLSTTQHSAERLRAVRFNGGPRIFNSSSGILRRCGGPGWIAAGDAATAHDPLSSSGIPHALGGGINAALVVAKELFAGGGALGQYEASIAENYRQYLRTRFQYYRRETRFPGAPFWDRRRTVIDLNPTIRLSPTARLRPPTIHLTGRVARALRDACTSAAVAHETIALVRGRFPQMPDERLILGLQEMLAAGSLRIVEPELVT